MLLIKINFNLVYNYYFKPCEETTRGVYRIAPFPSQIFIYINFKSIITTTLTFMVSTTHMLESGISTNLQTYACLKAY